MPLRVSFVDRQNRKEREREREGEHFEVAKNRSDKSRAQNFLSGNQSIWEFKIPGGRCVERSGVSCSRERSSRASSADCYRLS
jgi:hypothetical protein